MLRLTSGVTISDHVHVLAMDTEHVHLCDSLECFVKLSM